MTIRRVPVDATPDWPRKIANAINALILEIAKMQPFMPVPNSTVNIDVSASSQRIAIGTYSQVRVVNNGSATVWVTFGDNTVSTAATTGFPVPPGATEVLSVPYALLGTAINAAAIAAGATGKVYFTPGTSIA